MNIRKMKLALTIDLMNSPKTGNPLNFARSAMNQFKTEAGHYKGTVETQRLNISSDLIKSTHALMFENCTLDVDVISDQNGSRELIQSFELHENVTY